MKMNRIAAALAALALAVAPAALGAQGHAHHGQPQQAQHGAGHAAHAQGMKCSHGAHGEGAHTPAPAMLLMHRADLGLTDAQAQRLQALKADDAAGAHEVLTAEQRTRMTRVHAAMAASHGEGGHAHGSAHEGCCKDGACTAECRECCRGMECCKDGKCTAECEECCRRMSAAAAQGQAPPRP